MVEFIFSLKFHRQIKRTRPDVFSLIEKSISDSAALFGAKFRAERRFLIVSFDEKTFGFALDILLLIENLQKTLVSAAPDIYGWTAVITRENAADNIPRLFRSFPIESSGDISAETDSDGALSAAWTNIGIAANIWCHPDLRVELEQFIEFGPPLSFDEPNEGETLVDGGSFNEGKKPSGGINNAADGYARLLSIKHTKNQDERFPLIKKIIPLLEEKKFLNCLIISPPFSGKAESLKRFSEHIQSDFPPLVIRFGKECAGLACFAQVFNGAVYRLFTEYLPQTDIQQLSTLCALLNRRYLYREASAFLLEKAQNLFSELLKNYIKAAYIKNRKPIVIIENIDDAEDTARSVFFSAYAVWGSPAIILGTSAAKEMHPDWKPLFKYMFNIQPEELVFGAEPPRGLPKTMRETAYALCLFKKYFPGYELPVLFREEGKSAAFLDRALSMLCDYGVIRSVEDPKIQFAGFEKTAEEMMAAEDSCGSRADFIKNMVSGRLVAWALNGKIKASFDLMTVLHDLGKNADDRMLLNAVINDVTNGTFSCIEKSIESGLFLKIAGEQRAELLQNIFSSLKALLFGDEKEVKAVFGAIENSRKNTEVSISLYQAEVYSINALYKLGINDKLAALDAAKKSVLLSQNDPNAESLSRVYRIMSLVNLSNGRLSDAVDYISFATENAEKNANHDELTLNAYYASGAEYLFGNISKAQRLIELSKKSAVISGRMEWLLRSEFFSGRLYYETGDYDKAVSAFSLLREKIRHDADSDSYKTISAWVYRSEMMLGSHLPAEVIEDNLDFLLFQIEALYFAGDYETAVQKADIFIENIPAQSFQFVEQPDWSSGFTGIDFVFFDKKNFLTRLAAAYRSLSLCGINKWNAEDAARTMENFMRNERLSGSDPNDPFFFYAYYRVLDESEAPEVDKNTAISMAFKRLQSRASCIDDLDTKRSFLNRPFWNKALYQTAIEHKLI